MSNKVIDLVYKSVNTELSEIIDKLSSLSIELMASCCTLVTCISSIPKKTHSW